jgi:hypothetical protein
MCNCKAELILNLAKKSMTNQIDEMVEVAEQFDRWPEETSILDGLTQAIKTIRHYERRNIYELEEEVLKNV